MGACMCACMCVYVCVSIMCVVCLAFIKELL